MGHEQNMMIYSTENGIVALDSPVKLKILDMLRKGAVSFDDLVEQSGKAKSTISVHLDDLEKLKLIREKSSPDDKRKKYFFLNSICFAYSEMPMMKHYQKNMDTFEISGLNGESLMMHIFQTIRFGMEAYGFDPKPIMKRLGRDIGARLGPEFVSDDESGLLEELPEFWSSQNLGTMKVINNNPALMVTGCYHCSKMPDVGKTLCAMDEGILEGIFSSRLDINYAFKETECFGTGYDHCKFVFKEKK
ncbi:MAG: ArsR family transcriptional regulator [Euryarchaeota archaeon]|nr:ArsR family transcriptional regulator [Euryarchaeota archaeon]MBU4454025.1 ArsR family transcriptional regulator [Euryarchaeota archaeon]MDP3103104.1 V4R domain-containing protein [Candidatus Methanoperedens sp.]